eukprot:2262904-Alexandrium_andersonii.AAC.1
MPRLGRPARCAAGSPCEGVSRMGRPVGRRPAGSPCEGVPRRGRFAGRPAGRVVSARNHTSGPRHYG